MSDIFPVMRNKCPTTGGVNTGKECILPFNYNGRKYNKCGWKYGESKPWCSTKVVNSRHVGGQGEWGYCDSNCPVYPKYNNNIGNIDLYLYISLHQILIVSKFLCHLYVIHFKLP